MLVLLRYLLIMIELRCIGVTIILCRKLNLWFYMIEVVENIVVNIMDMYRMLG